MNLVADDMLRYDGRMSYVIVKTIKGRRYRYLQTSWRESKHVRTKSICLGPSDSAGGTSSDGSGPGGSVFLKHPREKDRALATAQRHAEQVEREQRKMFGETARERAERERQEHLHALHERYGLVVGRTQPASVGTSIANGPSASSSQADASSTEGEAEPG